MAKQQANGTTGAAQLGYVYDLADRASRINNPWGRIVIRLRKQGVGKLGPDQGVDLGGQLDRAGEQARLASAQSDLGNASLSGLASADPMATYNFTWMWKNLSVENLRR